MRTETLDAVATLRRQQMPPDEIRAVLAADDPVVVRRLLELHRERMEEWLQEQRRIVAWLERTLTGMDEGLVDGSRRVHQSSDLDRGPSRR